MQHERTRSSTGQRSTTGGQDGAGDRGGHGIGKAIAAALAAAGASVVINHNHTPEQAGKAVAEITGAGGRAIAAAADVSNRAEYQAMVDQLLAESGHWDILVNNAAVAITKPFGTITEAEFDLSFAVSVKGCSTACSSPGSISPTTGGSSPFQLDHRADAARVHGV